MGFFCYTRWVNSIGHGLAKEFAIEMGVSVAQIQLWDKRLKEGG